MIRYLAGGKFGDFIHSLSVINEKYLKFGEKGILYLSEQGDRFVNGVDATYRDTKDFILLQDYIHDYLLYNGEEYDIDLSCWRNADFSRITYPRQMDLVYSIEWGKHPWLSKAPLDESWANKTVISTSTARFPGSIKWQRFLNDNIVFVSYSNNDYQFFCNFTKITLPWHRPKSFLELCMIIRSCKCFVGSFSGILTLAFAFHRTCFIGQYVPYECFIQDYEKRIPNLYIDKWEEKDHSIYDTLFELGDKLEVPRLVGD